MIYPIIAAIGFCIINGEHDAWKIRKHKKINHAINGTLYCLFVLVCVFFEDLGFSYLDIVRGLMLLCLRPLVFDQYLNVRRGLPLDYQPGSEPEKVGSWIDRQENALFGHQWAWALSNAIYAVCFAVGLVWVG